jgi:UDP-GlcNAc:undecaprenyl-phosphate GlcNAc-1-phosphate transferase
MPLLIAFALAVVLTPLAARLASGVGLVDRPDGNPLKIHERPVPVLGGAAVLGAILPTWAATHEFSAAVAGAAALALAAGVLDDVRPLPAWALATASAASGVMLTVGGARIGSLGSFDRLGVVALAVACASAVNIVDGQDGLAAGVAAVAALGLAGLASGRATSGALSLAGALGGFLVSNRPPARIFLGNGGALAVGVLLAGSAAGAARSSDPHALLAVAACLGVLMFELAFTVGRRLVSGQPLTSGDRLHSYDLLAARLGRRGPVTLAGCAFGGVAAGAGLLVQAIPAAGVVAVTVTAAAAAAGAVRLWSWAEPPRRVGGEPALEARNHPDAR